jgi:hypothetical protein
MNYRVTTAALTLLSLVAATSAHADGGDHNGNGNRGFLNGNMNGNNFASTSRSRASATQSYEGYQGIDGSGNSSNNNNTTFRERLQAPGIAAPGLTSGGNTCAGSWGLGLSGPGFGISGGNTYEMRGCEARTVAQQIYSWGYRRQAINLLIGEHPMVQRAFANTAAASPRKKRH